MLQFQEKSSQNGRIIPPFCQRIVELYHPRSNVWYICTYPFFLQLIDQQNYTNLAPMCGRYLPYVLFLPLQDSRILPPMNEWVVDLYYVLFLPLQGSRILPPMNKWVVDLYYALFLPLQGSRIVPPLNQGWQNCNMHAQRVANF